MNWLKKIMYGRYGGDNLSKALLFLSLLLLVIVGLLPKSLSILSVIAYIPTIICIYRMFSKNIFKRQRENYKYLKLENSVIKWSKQKLGAAKNFKTHKYFNCPDCKQRLRVPRGQGHITITCPKCKKSFKAKS
ncbi:hypothetical protein CLPUN_23350 [Clostridium puniceum]|uniref:Zn-finger containing protein n=1 Tax=Clostridium puniceum TaxID=29367 RepID=A0A1S8THJ5_9CLOT|nr:hypothetical protein [Clostridium puniceum]OOM77218.1 hypothetical protein CLPUN_23350 [Clostridium puniceum]